MITYINNINNLIDIINNRVFIRNNIDNIYRKYK